MSYAANWRLYYVIAFFAHLVAWLFFSLALPHLKIHAEPPPVVEEIAWESIDDVLLVDEVSEEMIAAAEEDPALGPEIEPVFVPETEPEPPIEVVEEVPTEEETPQEAEDEEEAIAKLKEQPSEEEKKESGNIAIRSNSNGQTMGEPAKLIREVQPADGAVSFKGRISVSAHINREGEVDGTKIMISSGNLIFDSVAMNIVRKEWKFRPATDTEGKPMESNYICSLYFNTKQHRKN